MTTDYRKTTLIETATAAGLPTENEGGRIHVGRWQSVDCKPIWGVGTGRVTLPWLTQEADGRVRIVAPGFGDGRRWTADDGEGAVAALLAERARLVNDEPAAAVPYNY